MGQRTCTLLPTSAAALKPERQPDEKPAMEAKKLRNAEYHLHRRILKPLDVGDQVRVQSLRPNEKAWQPAVVSEKVDARSYKVVTDNGAELHRARKHLRKATPSTWPASNVQQPPADPPSAPLGSGPDEQPMADHAPSTPPPPLKMHDPDFLMTNQPVAQPAPSPPRGYPPPGNSPRRTRSGHVIMAPAGNAPPSPPINERLAGQLGCHNYSRWYHSSWISMLQEEYRRAGDLDMSWCCFHCNTANVSSFTFHDYIMSQNQTLLACSKSMVMTLCLSLPLHQFSHWLLIQSRYGQFPSISCS